MNTAKQYLKQYESAVKAAQRVRREYEEELDLIDNIRSSLGASLRGDKQEGRTPGAQTVREGRRVTRSRSCSYRDAADDIPYRDAGSGRQGERTV